MQELKAELQDLKTNKRIEVSEKLKKAKELGDLSENSEYIEAREEQSRTETKIGELEEMIHNASLIQKNDHSQIVKIGSTIEVERADGKKLKFTIVGANETKPEAGLISNESPLGKAFLEKRAGEKTTVETPNGKVEYKIKAIE